MTFFNTVTTTDLLNQEAAKRCIFCKKFHESKNCNYGSGLSLKERFAKIREASKCFRCLTGDHLARHCKQQVKCTLCQGTHYKILCNRGDKIVLNENKKTSVYYGVDEIILQTLVLKLHGPISTQQVRTLIDCGSSRSYVSTPAVVKFGLKAIGTMELAHTLFGGRVTGATRHAVYEVVVSNNHNTFRQRYQLIEVEKICGPIAPTPRGIG